jgi:hypothetical protein
MITSANPMTPLVHFPGPGIPNPLAFNLTPALFVGFSQTFFMKLPPLSDNKFHGRVL